MIDSGALPIGWSLVPLGELLTSIDSGKSFKCEERPPEAHEVGVIKVSAVSWGEYQEAESKTCVDVNRVEPAYFVKPGDFLFSRANTIDLVGACVIVGRVSKRLMLSDKILRLHFATEDLKPWVLQYLRSKVGRHQIELLASGNQESMRNIGQERLRQIQIALPPSNERESISFKLDELLSQLAAASNELFAAKRKLSLYRQSLLKSAVEGDLTADARRSRSTGPDLESIPDGWTRFSIANLTSLVTSGSRGWAEHYADEGAVFIRSQDIKHDVLSLAACAHVNPPQGGEGMRTRARKDDVLLTITGANVGKCARVAMSLDEAYVSQHVALIRLREPTLAPYVHMYVIAEAGGRGRLNKMAYGAGKPGLNLEQVRSLEVPVPPAWEIELITQRIDTLMEAVSRLEAEIDERLRSVAVQRQNIFRAAFSGQLVPQDPNDEPASVLLERIRARRQAAAPATKRKPGRAAKATA